MVAPMACRLAMSVPRRLEMKGISLSTMATAVLSSSEKSSSRNEACGSSSPQRRKQRPLLPLSASCSLTRLRCFHQSERGQQWSICKRRSGRSVASRPLYTRVQRNFTTHAARKVRKSASYKLVQIAPPECVGRPLAGLYTAPCACTLHGIC